MKKERVFYSKTLKIAVAIFIVFFMFIAVFLVFQNIKNDKNNMLNSSEQQTTTQVSNITEQNKLNAETKVQSGTVTVYYLDEKGNELIEKSVKTGNVGSWYDVEEVDISKYVISEEPITQAGYYELGNIDVKFIYKPSSSEVKYKVENDKENSVDIVFNNTKVKTPYGVKIITKDENGNVINGGEFEYKKAGNMLRKGTVLNGCFYVGKIFINEDGSIPYEIVQTKATAGYEKVQENIGLNLISVWNNETNKYNLTNAETNVSGTKAYINDNNEIVIEIINKQYKDMYELEVVYKTENELLDGTKINVEKLNNKIIEEYTESGKLYVGAFEVKEPGKDTYTIYETETKEGYETVVSKQTPGKIQIEKNFNEQTKKYNISVKTNNIEGLWAEKQENSNKIIVYIQTKKIVDKYDLCMKKFISEIDGKEIVGREPIVEITEDGKIEYKQNNEIEKASNKQEVTYRLRMYNESNIKGKGKRVIEYIPDGLVFLPENEKNIEYGWKAYIQDKDGALIEAEKIEDATIIVSDYLVDKEIEGFDIEAVLQKIKSENKLENNSEDKNLSEQTNIPNHLDVEAVFVVDENKITTEDRIIENKVQIEKNENDDNSTNDEATEKLYVKYFDLGIKKYIKEVKVKNNIAETIQQIGEARKGQLVKIDIAKSEVENTTITVTYVLKVTNIGEIEGYATELVDYIPEDFKLVEDGVWKIKDKMAVTTKLQNKLLKPGDSTTIEITFDWKLTQDNIGSRINEGKITKYENPYDAIDRTNDNNDKEELLVTVRTGGGIYYIIPIIILIGVAGVVIFIVDKNRKNNN